MKCSNCGKEIFKLFKGGYLHSRMGACQKAERMMKEVAKPEAWRCKKHKKTKRLVVANCYTCLTNVARELKKTEKLRGGY